VPDAGPSHDGHGGQRRPGGQAPVAGQVHPAGHRNARRVREYRKSRGDRAGDALFSILARAGIGPAHLLTTRGRMPGRPRITPVILVMQGQQRWLVAPYGAVPWVLNARAAGQVRLRRGRDRHDYTIRQLPAAQAGPILQRYLRIAPATRPYFQASKDSPVADFIAEADRHPVFELTPLSETSAGSGGAVPGWLKKAALGRGVVLAARMWVLGHVAGRRCVGLRPGRVGRWGPADRPCGICGLLRLWPSGRCRAGRVIPSVGGVPGGYRRYRSREHAMSEVEK